MKLEMNIGLAVSLNDPFTPGAPVPADHALRVAVAFFGTPEAWTIRRSATERTLVLRFDWDPGVFDAHVYGYRLAAALGQDCIAIYNPADDAGHLVGPNAAAWGEFNPAYFLRFDPAFYEEE